MKDIMEGVCLSNSGGIERTQQNPFQSEFTCLFILEQCSAAERTFYEPQQHQHTTYQCSKGQCSAEQRAGGPVDTGPSSAYCSAVAAWHLPKHAGEHGSTS